MEQNIPPELSPKATFDINLTLKELTAAVIGILGYMFLAISAKEDINEIASREKGTKVQGEPSQAPLLAAVSVVLIVITNIILGRVAIARFKERASGIQAGSETGSLTPNKNIVWGLIAAILGHSLEAVGVLQRASEPVQVTII